MGTAGRHWYAYCGGDPVNKYDPSGLRAIVANDARGEFEAWYKQNCTMGDKLMYAGFPSGNEGASRVWGFQWNGFNSSFYHYESRFNELGFSGKEIDVSTMNGTDMALAAAILDPNKTYVFDKSGWRSANDGDMASTAASADLAVGRGMAAADRAIGNGLAWVGEKAAELDPILIPLTAPGGMPQIDLPKGAVGYVGLGATRMLGMLRALRASNVFVNADRVITRLAPSLQGLESGSLKILSGGERLAPTLGASEVESIMAGEVARRANGARAALEGIPFADKNVIAFGAYYDSEGMARLAIATNGRGAMTSAANPLRKIFRDLPGIETSNADIIFMGGGGGIHAETKLLLTLRPFAIGASQDICLRQCAPLLGQAGVRIMTPIAPSIRGFAPTFALGDDALGLYRDALAGAGR